MSNSATHHKFYDQGAEFYVCPTCERDFVTLDEFDYDETYDCCGECAASIREDFAADDTPNHDTTYEAHN